MATVRRTYNQFRGVDFRGEEISYQRSPDSLNMWRSYKSSDCICTRPGLTLRTGLLQPVYGIYGHGDNLLIHSGNRLVRVGDTELAFLFGGLAENKSCGFSFGEKVYLLDGQNYFCYDGQNVGEVEGHIPTTSIGRSPAGGGKTLEDVNLLSDYRINTFLGDGESKSFSLDTQNIDSDFTPKVVINNITYVPDSVDWEQGIVTMKFPPEKPRVDGQDNVSIRFKKHIPGNQDKIRGCTIAQVFDNRVFVSGNPQYPNTLWHSSLEDPTYFSDLDYYTEGLDNAPITGMAAGNNALWVFRAPGNTGTNVFYHTPALDGDYGKIYPSVHSGAAVGCIGKAINFLDDIVFFSPRGMEAISGSANGEQAVSHRSAMVDRKLLAEREYRNMLLEEWEGYLMIFVGDKVYLADSRQMVSMEGHREYEFFYWQMEKKVLSALVWNGELYLGMKDGVYQMKEGVPVNSWWTTPVDKFGQPNRWKTLDGRPAVAEGKGKSLQIHARSNDDGDWTEVADLKDVEDAAVFRVKKKKCKDLRLKFSSSEGFSLEDVTLEAQIGGVIKRI